MTDKKYKTVSPCQAFTEQISMCWSSDSESYMYTAPI